MCDGQTPTSEFYSGEATLACFSTSSRIPDKTEPKLLMISKEDEHHRPRVQGVSQLSRHLVIPGGGGVQYLARLLGRARALEVTFIRTDAQGG